MEENIDELKRLLYTNSLTQYGKRKLINYYEQQIQSLKDNFISKEVIKEKKDKIKQEHQDIISDNTLSMLDRLINSKLTKGKLEILDELLEENDV